MKVLHRAAERGVGEYGWLSTRYSFSFAQWYNPARMGFGALRVINDDVIAAGSGFGAHSHRDMEIITIVTEGSLRHEDSMGTKGIVGTGEVQVMSAGTGITHAEYNASEEEPLKLFQIWIEPHQTGHAPRYAQARGDITTPGLHLLVEPCKEERQTLPLGIHQDAYISLAVLEGGQSMRYAPKSPGNGVYVFVVDGKVTVSGVELRERDALGLMEDDSNLELSTDTTARALIFEVPV